MHGPTRVRYLLTALLAAGLVGSPLAAQSGSATGVVTDSANGQPVGQVRVRVSGTTRAVATADNGRFTLNAIAPGAVILEFSRIGYAPRRVPVTIGATTPTTIDVLMSQATMTLDAVVT